ncbi:hypothetical protein PYCCODRAFT_449708 [Trametes coccinea BRFM310]|uniref:Uncharacterized protein n=1 Tax=Trametes coccinea (strain BRFM310) TaxID=1353009 RepID=A0A1Y2IM27_TRAC3|nr:hypothetical protein PYCCODRAFT_449708 [Trametes coccinea BRFM310]
MGADVIILRACFGPMYRPAGSSANHLLAAVFSRQTQSIRTSMEYGVVRPLGYSSRREPLWRIVTCVGNIDIDMQKTTHLFLSNCHPGGQICRNQQVMTRQCIRDSMSVPWKFRHRRYSQTTYGPVRDGLQYLGICIRSHMWHVSIVPKSARVERST